MQTFSEFKESLDKLQHWFNSIRIPNSYAVTLTFSNDGMHQASIAGNGAYRNKEREGAIKLLERFLNNLNKTFLTATPHSSSDRLKCIPAMVGYGTHRLDFHLLLERPPNIPVPAYKAIIKELWPYGNIDAKPMSKINWVRNITNILHKPFIAGMIQDHVIMDLVTR